MDNQIQKWFFTLLAQTFQKINKKITQFFEDFLFCPFYGKKRWLNLKMRTKKWLGNYLTKNFRHFLFSCNPIWRSDDFLDFTYSMIQNHCAFVRQSSSNFSFLSFWKYVGLLQLANRSKKQSSVTSLRYLLPLEITKDFLRGNTTGWPVWIAVTVVTPKYFYFEQIFGHAKFYNLLALFQSTVD